MRWILNGAPNQLIGVLVVGCALAISLFGFRVWTKRFPGPPEDNDFVSGMLGIVGAVYGIVLAFVIVTVWQNLDRAQDTAKNEASALARIVQDVRVLDARDGRRVDDAVRAYIDEVVNVEWPLMRVGRESTGAQRTLDDLGVALEHANPQGAVQETWYSEAVQKYNEVVHERRDRLDEAERELPAPFWLLLFAGAVLPIWFTFLLNVRNRRVHVATIAIVAILVSYNLFLAMALEHPYSGSISVKPTPFLRGVLVSR